MSKKIIKKLLLILSLCLCVNCTKTEEVHVQPAEGGQDSGGGNTSFASRDQIDFSFNELAMHSETLFKVFLDISKEQKFDLPFKNSDLIKYIGKIKYKLNSKDCDSNNVICVSIIGSKKIPKDSIYEEASLAMITNTYRKLGVDSLEISILEIFLRKNINEILERVFVKSIFYKDLHTLIQEISREILFLEKIKLSGNSYDVKACRSLSNMTALLNRLENEVEFIKESERNDFNTEEISRIKNIFFSYYEKSCIYSAKIQYQELRSILGNMEIIIDKLRKNNY